MVIEIVQGRETWCFLTLVNNDNHHFSSDYDMLDPVPGT